MPRPTLVGTQPAIHNGGASGENSVSITMTLDANATSITFMFGGYDQTDRAHPGSCSITAGGSGALTLVDSDNNTAFSGEQYSGAFVMHDTDPNWPSAGSITVTWNVNEGFVQARACLNQWQDTDTAGTPVPDFASSVSDASEAPSVTLTTDAALDIMLASSAFYNDDPTTEAGELGYADNGGGSSSTYWWQEDADGASSTIELAGISAAHATVAFVLRGTSDGETASGTPIIPAATASGTAAITRNANGTPSIPAASASGAATVVRGASGAATLSSLVAAGAASIAAVVTASGSPSIPAVTSAGVAQIRKSASGSPSTPSITATGLATVGAVIAAAGSPSIPAVTAAGQASRTSVKITDVNTDESWNDGDTGIPITGTGFV